MSEESEELEELLSFGERTDVDERLELSFLKKRMIFLNSDVTDYNIDDVIKKLKILDTNKKEPILLSINTNGGCAYNILRVYDQIRRMKSPVDIVVEGKAFSAGAFITGICGRKRYATKNSSFMLHEISSFSWGKLTDQEIDLDETKRLQKTIINLLKKRCKLKKKDVERFTNNKDWNFTAKIAKKYNIIDEVL